MFENSWSLGGDLKVSYTREPTLGGLLSLYLVMNEIINTQ